MYFIIFWEFLKLIPIHFEHVILRSEINFSVFNEKSIQSCLKGDLREVILIVHHVGYIIAHKTIFICQNSYNFTLEI